MIKAVLDGELLPVLIKEIQQAEDSIWVVMFEWAWYPGQHTGSVQDINRELCIRAKNRTDVRVVLHNESMGRPLHKINRLSSSHLRQSGAQVKWGNSGAPLHAKVWIFDQTRVVMGSHNISARAVRTNIEAGVLFDDPDEVKKVVEWFEAIWIKAM